MLDSHRSRFVRSLSADASAVDRVLNALPDGLMIVQGEGVIVYANQQAEQLFGYTEAELLGMSVDLLLPDAQRTSHAEHRADYAKHPRVRSMGSGLSLAGRRSDGTEFPVEISLSPLETAGEPLFVATIRDVAEQQAYEQFARTAQNRLAIAADRERIARDLHDRVIQRLFGIGTGLQSFASTAEDERLRDRCDRAVDEIDLAIKELRTSIFTLSHHNSGTLRSEAIRIAEEAAVKLGFRPTVTFVGVLDHIDGLILDHATATLTEALSNVARHAAATQASVTIEATRDELRLIVTDNGRGFEHPPTSGNGLVNLQSRAGELGGSCVVASNPVGGTTLLWSVQLC